MSTDSEAGMSTGKKIAAGAALGVAVPAAVGVAWKLLGNGGAMQGAKRKTQPSSRSANSGASRGNGRTKEQLYEQAKRLDIEGRSSMTKAQLERAISRTRS